MYQQPLKALVWKTCEGPSLPGVLSVKIRQLIKSWH